MDLVLKVEQGCNDKLGRAKPEPLLNKVKSLENGSLPLYYVLEQENIRSQDMVYEEHAWRKLSLEQNRPG